MPRELPRYVALEKVKIRTLHDREPRLVFAGEAILFDGVPGNSLCPANGAARQAKLKALRAIIAERASGAATDTLCCVARGIGFTGNDDVAAATFIKTFMAVETSRQSAQSSTRGKSHGNLS